MDIVVIVIAEIISKVLSHLIIQYLERRYKEKDPAQDGEES